MSIHHFISHIFSALNIDNVVFSSDDFFSGTPAPAEKSGKSSKRSSKASSRAQSPGASGSAKKGGKTVPTLKIKFGGRSRRKGGGEINKVHRVPE